MKKKFNKVFAKHWLMPYINYQCGTFYGLSLPAFRFVFMCLCSNLIDCDNIHISPIRAIPFSLDSFSLLFYVTRDTDELEFISSRSFKYSTIKKYGKLYRDNVGFYTFQFKPL